MNDIIQQNKHTILFKEKWNFLDENVLPFLQKKIDEAEKAHKKNLFEDFNDVEMIQWFLLRKEYLDESKDHSKRTIQEYERELRIFVKHILLYAHEIGVDIETIKDHSLFKSLERRHIRKYHEWLATNSPYVKQHGPYSAATITRKTTILKNFFSFLYHVKYIDIPIHEGFKKVKVDKEDRPNRDLGPKEVKELLDYFRKQKHDIAFAIIHILTTTGIRNEEFCKLRVKDLQYDSIKGEYYLNIIGKGNKRRQVPLREKTLQSIRLFRKARGYNDIFLSKPEEPLFMTNTGRPYTPAYLSQYLSKAISSTNLPFIKERSTKITPHTFRHSFSIISRLSGADVYTIMRSLGHEKIDTTMIYLEKIFERENHAIHEWNAEVFGDYI